MENIINKLDISIKNALGVYKDSSTALINYLKDRSAVGFNKEQFILFRNNYFFRTYRTVPCITKVVESAALHGDYLTLNCASTNLYEEAGAGQPHKAHPDLLMKSHNKHAQRVFGADGISLIESLDSKNILNETRQFTEVQRSLYNSSHHIEVLAANYAQEAAATDMLTLFLESFFEPYQSLYSPKEYEDLTEYFYCHIDGLEQKHADEAKYCLFEWCRSQDDAEIAVKAVTAILKAQSDLWISLKAGLEKSGNGDPLIPVNYIYKNEKIYAL